MSSLGRDPLDPDLVERLRAAGARVDQRFDPFAAYAALFAAEGEGATLEDRFALEAASLGVPQNALPDVARRRAMEDFYGHRWSGFEIVGTEARNDPIRVVPYDGRWPAIFSMWSERIASQLGEVALRIEHVGSTAVLGLAAKPIVDIQVSVAELEDEDGYVPGLALAGVNLRSRDSAHRYFRPPPAEPRTVHVHVCESGGTWEREHLLFRDYLRAHDDVRDAYARLKAELAATSSADRLAYGEGKGPFIRSAMAAAEAWISTGR
ncbi:MAG TPA: GrpB family protein [Acidimicrobiia bacterium]|nr:GrpB family protein [Acidimicrobiia bacterium]